MTTQIRFNTYDLLRRAVEDGVIRANYALDVDLIDAIMDELGQVLDLTKGDENDEPTEPRGE